MVTWEAVQKESYLSKLEKQKEDSKEEVLRRTAHRCTGHHPPPAGLGAESAAPGPLLSSPGAAMLPGAAQDERRKLRLAERGRV